MEKILVIKHKYSYRSKIRTFSSVQEEENNIWMNREGTSDKTCKCGTWLKHWENISKLELPYTCRVDNCNNAVEVGAHIHNPITHSADYIVPMCKACNARIDRFHLKDETIIVLAEKYLTCEDFFNRIH